MPRKALFRFAENFETRTINWENFETNYIYIGVLLMEITLTSAELADLLNEAKRNGGYPEHTCKCC